MLTDYLLRFQDAGIRWLTFSGLTLTIAWAAARFLVPLSRPRLDQVQVARRIEQALPERTRGLASSIAFLQRSDGGASRMCISRVSNVPPPAKGTRPVSISNATAPSE